MLWVSDIPGRATKSPPGPNKKLCCNNYYLDTTPLAQIKILNILDTKLDPAWDSSQRDRNMIEITILDKKSRFGIARVTAGYQLEL